MRPPVAIVISSRRVSAKTSMNPAASCVLGEAVPSVAGPIRVASPSRDLRNGPLPCYLPLQFCGRILRRCRIGRPSAPAVDGSLLHDNKCLVRVLEAGQTHISADAPGPGRSSRYLIMVHDLVMGRRQQFSRIATFRAESSSYNQR